MRAQSGRVRDGAGAAWPAAERFECDGDYGDHDQRQRPPALQRRAPDAGRHALRQDPRFGTTRTDIGVDVGNLLNTNYATGWENTYQHSIGNTGNGGTWNQPTAVYTPRFVRVNLTLN